MQVFLFFAVSHFIMAYLYPLLGEMIWLLKAGGLKSIAWQRHDVDKERLNSEAEKEKNCVSVKKYGVYLFHNLLSMFFASIKQLKFEYLITANQNTFARYFDIYSILAYLYPQQ